MGNGTVAAEGDLWFFAAGQTGTRAGVTLLAAASCSAGRGQPRGARRARRGGPSGTGAAGRGHGCRSGGGTPPNGRPRAPRRRRSPSPCRPRSRRSPRCPVCGVALDTLSWRAVPAKGEGGEVRTFVVAYCAACGSALGTSPGPHKPATARSCPRACASRTPRPPASPWRRTAVSVRDSGSARRAPGGGSGAPPRRSPPRPAAGQRRTGGCPGPRTAGRPRRGDAPAGSSLAATAATPDRMAGARRHGRRPAVDRPPPMRRGCSMTPASFAGSGGRNTGYCDSSCTATSRAVHGGRSAGRRPRTSTPWIIAHGDAPGGTEEPQPPPCDGTSPPEVAGAYHLDLADARVGIHHQPPTGCPQGGVGACGTVGVHALVTIAEDADRAGSAVGGHAHRQIGRHSQQQMPHTDRGRHPRRARAESHIAEVDRHVTDGQAIVGTHLAGRHRTPVPVTDPTASGASLTATRAMTPLRAIRDSAARVANSHPTRRAADLVPACPREEAMSATAMAVATRATPPGAQLLFGHQGPAKTRLNSATATKTATRGAATHASGWGRRWPAPGRRSTAPRPLPARGTIRPA